MQFIVFMVALVVVFLATVAAYSGVVLLGDGAFGNPRMSRGSWTFVCVVAVIVVVASTAVSGAEGFAGGMAGVVAFYHFYKRFLRTR